MRFDAAAHGFKPQRQAADVRKLARGGHKADRGHIVKMHGAQVHPQQAENLALLAQGQVAAVAGEAGHDGAARRGAAFNVQHCARVGCRNIDIAGFHRQRNGVVGPGGQANAPKGQAQGRRRKKTRGCESAHGGF